MEFTIKLFISFIILMLTVNVSADSNEEEYLKAQRFKCVQKNIIELDDGISSAEIVGKAVLSECERECIDVVKYMAEAKGISFGNSMKNKTIQRGIDWATSKVLQYRVSEKKKGVIEHINIENWEFIYGKSKLGKFYEITTMAENAGSGMVIKCLDSGSQAVDGLQINLYIVAGKKSPFKKNLTENKKLVAIGTYFDNKYSNDSNEYLWALMNKNMVIKISPLIHPFIDKLMKTKELKLDLEELGRPIIYDLTGFSDSIDRLSKSCKSFNIDRK